MRWSFKTTNLSPWHYYRVLPSSWRDGSRGSHSAGEDTHFRALPRTSNLARGKHPHTAHFRLARSLHPRRSQGFGNPPPPESRPGLREIPYTTTLSSLWSYGVFVPEYPARAGVPLRIWGFASTIRTLPNMVGGLRKQAHKSLYLPLRSLALFPALWITLRTYITTLV